MIKERIKKFWQEIDKSDKNPSAFLIINPKNIFYLTKFTGEGILLLTPEQKCLITDSRYTEQAKQEAIGCQITIQDMKRSDAQTESLYKLISELKIKELGFESDVLNVNLYHKYQEYFPQTKLYPFKNIIEKLRMIKDYKEIDILKKSAKIATRSFLQTIISIQSGVSETSIASLLNFNMRKNGAKKEAFDLIVTSGERGTLIHGEPSSKKIEDEELIIIDFGAVFEMYNSDCTRSFVLDKATYDQRKIFDIIKRTQTETLQQVRPGVRCCDLDKYARNIIKDNGYGDYFNHSLGHGVGLDIHELPRLNHTDETVLQPGMVVTIEPGIYVPKVGGVRIEDTVVVTEKGYEVITVLPKELLISSYHEDNCNDIII